MKILTFKKIESENSRSRSTRTVLITTVLRSNTDRTHSMEFYL